MAPLAALVIVAHTAGASNETTAFWALVFFLARVTHAAVYWMAIPYVRTLAFVVGLIATLGKFCELVSAAPIS